MLSRRLLPAALGLGLALTAPVLAQAPAPTVGVAEATTTEVTPRVRFVGRAEAVDRVELIARVPGFLDERRFEQGQPVAAGDLLFVIEKAPYEATLAQREAELARARAELENASAQLERGRTLLENNNIPAAEVDERRAREQIAEARVLEAQAAVRTAELNLGYTDIEAPIAGRIGRSIYSVGALVGPDSGPLATIVRQDPIYVTFPVSQAVLTRARQEAIASGEPLDLVVRAELATGEFYDETGTLAFAEVEVDRSTDTLPVRATFANPNGLLTPGQFLTVVLEQGERVEALTIPAAALLVDQAGTYVLVVDADETVEQRRVGLGEGAPAGAAVVAEGLQAGERVIVEGVQKVRPGQTVTAAPVEEVSGS